MPSLQGNKITGLVVAACLGLSLATGCTASGSRSIGPNATAPTASQNQSQSSLAISAQTALANYHAVDGAFYDSARLSSSASFATKQLGALNSTTGGSGSTLTSVNVGASTNTSNTSGGSGTGLNLNTDINADFNTTMESMQRLNSQLRTGLESTGSVSFTEDNNSIINETRLRTNIESAINSNTNNDLQGFSDNSILQNGRLNLNGNVSGMTSVQSQQLLRNSSRGFNTSAGQIRSQTNADGSIIRFFGTSFEGNDTRRNVLVADRVMGNARLGSDLMLSETGDGFTTDANRVSSLNADGSINLVTRSSTNFDNGDRIEILEERVVDASGRAAGNGTLTLTDTNGRSQSFDLRTMANVDGSLVSNLASRDNNMDRLVLRENASGNATLSFVNTTSGSENSRANLDFNAMLDAMSNFDFS